MATFCTTDGFWYDPTPLTWPGGDLTPPPVASAAAESGWLVVATGTDPCGQYDHGTHSTIIARSVDDGPFAVLSTGAHVTGEGPYSTAPGDLYCYSYGPNFDNTDPEQALPDPPTVPMPSLPDLGIGNASVAAHYIYEIVNNDGDPIGGQFPLAVPDMSRVLSQMGTLNATIPRSHPLANRGYLDPPGREIVVTRNGKVVWNGPITYLRRAHAEQVVTLRARELTWYLYNATLDVDYSATSTDVFDIVRDLVVVALGKTGGSRFSFSVTAGSAGVTKTVDYKAAYRYRIGQLIEDLAADPTDGFDFRLTVDGTCARDITRVLELGAPSLGAEILGRKLQPGGGLQDLVEELDLDQSGNVVHLLPGLGDTLTAVNTGSLAAGDPSIEYVLNRPDLDSADDLATGVVNELRRVVQPPNALYSAAYIPRADLPYGWCDLGDTVLFADPMTGLDSSGRVASITTTPAASGQREMVQLAVAAPLTELGT